MDKYELINGLRAAYGQMSVSDVKTLNPEGNYIESTISFEKNDEETKQRILKAQGANDEAVKAVRLEQEEKQKAEETFQKLYQQRKGGGFHSGPYRKG